MSTQQSNDRGPWLIVLAVAFIGGAIGGPDGAQTGGWVGVAVMIGWIIHEHTSIGRRQRAAAAEAAEIDAEEAAEREG